MRNSVSNLVKIAQNFGKNLSNGPKIIKKNYLKKNSEFIKANDRSFAEFSFAKKSHRNETMPKIPYGFQKLPLKKIPKIFILNQKFTVIIRKVFRLVHFRTDILLCYIPSKIPKIFQKI